MFEVMEERVLAKAKGAALASVTWGAGIAAAIAAWACAHVALAAWVSADHGVIAAAGLATAIHAVAALVLVAVARSQGASS